MDVEDDEITEEQVAEAEAEAAEPDDEVDEDEAEAPQEPVAAEPQSGATPEEWEQRAQKLERRAATYTRGVSEIMGDDALDLIPCPCCSMTIHPMFVSKHDAGRYPEDVKAAVLTFLGFAQEQEYEQDQEVDTCTKCKGKGFTKTGSQVEGNKRRKCRHCKGFGYFPPPGESEQREATVADFHYPADEAPQPLASDQVDIAGEPRYLPDGRENPNFGLWPQYKVEVPPWGVTAGLTAQDTVNASGPAGS